MGFDGGETKALLGQQDVALVDLREERERSRDGMIPGSLHVAYPGLRSSLQAVWHGLQASA
jgi:rhodanese-related sulfurtransferase